MQEPSGRYTHRCVERARGGRHPRRPLARLAEPVEPWAFTDRDLSWAVVTYVWGLPRQPVPGSHPDDVRRWSGSHAEPLLEVVLEYLELAYRLPDWTADTPEAAEERVAGLLEGDPFLTRQAARSLAAWSVHTWLSWAPEPSP